MKTELDIKISQQQAILDNIPDIAWLKDKEGRFIAVNKPFAKSCGFDQEELVGKTDLDIWPADLAKRYMADDEDVMATGKQKKVREPLEDRKLNKRWIETIKTPIYNTGGEVIGTTGIARDITERIVNEEKLHKAYDELEIRVKERTADLERINKTLLNEIIQHKKTESALIEAQERYRRIVEFSPYGIAIHSEGRIVYTNLSGAKIIGAHDPAELIGKAVFDLVHPAYHDLVKERIHIQTQGKVAPLVEEKFLRMDGTSVDVEILAIPFTFNGKPATYGVFMDITERKKAQETHLENLRLEAADKAKSEFLASMSHELRTPLNASIGFSELLKIGIAGELNPRQKDFIENVIVSNQFLLALINDILDLSKIEAGKIKLVFENTSLRSTIQETLTLIREKAMRHKVLLNTEYDPAIDFICADKQRLKQILFNLLSNAVKFSKENGGTITINVKKAGDMASISVSDTGIGIKPEYLGKLFQKFEQLETGISVKYGGTGLGLAISKQLVEMHGGKISVESRFTQGTTFTFTLPISRNETRT